MDWPPYATNDAHEEPGRLWNDLDLDDIVESFIGSLAAGVVLLLVVRTLARRRHARHVRHAQHHQQRSM